MYFFKFKFLIEKTFFKAMSLAECRKDLDIDKCVRMALVHDIGEAIIGGFFVIFLE